MFDEQTLAGWLSSASMDRTAAYLHGGRCHREMSDQTLLGTWTAAGKALCLDIMSDQKREAENDLASEMSLRGMIIPLHLLQAELQNLNKTLVDRVERLRRENPEELLRLDDHLAAALSAFQTNKQEGH